MALLGNGTADKDGFIIDGTTLTGYTGPGGDITIPDDVETIGISVFKDNKNITWVTFSTSVTTIGDYAFQGCSKVLGVSLNAGLTTIGQQAFAGVSFGGSIQIDYTNRLRIPATVTQIGSGAFMNSEYLQEVEFLDPAASESNPNTTLATDIDKHYMQYAFQNCKNLYKVTLPKRLLEIPDAMFDGCTSLREVKFGDQLTKIGNSAFKGCALVGIQPPSTVTDIGDYAFQNCTKLDYVALSEGLTTIGKEAFSAISTNRTGSDVTLTIPATVSKIGSGAFMNSAVAAVTFLDPDASESNPNTTLATDKDKYYMQYAFQNCKNLQTVTLPKRLLEIPDTMFDGCTSLETVTFGDQLTKIGNNAFKDCALAEITLPTTVTDIGDYAFQNCTKLKTVTLNEGLATIGQQAFHAISSDNTGNVTLTIPATVSKIGSSAFMNSAVAAVTFADETAQGSGKNPAGTLSTADNNMKHAFQNCAKLKTVTLPKRLLEIPDTMFDGCTSLATVTFGDQLTKIGTSAFNGCALAEITLPTTVTDIGDYAFQNCTKLKSVTLNEGLATIGTYAFNNVPFGDAQKPGKLRIPGTVTRIKSYAFQSSPYLQEVVFANGANTDLTLESGTFYGCAKLKTVILPTRLKSLPVSFVDSADLTTLYIPASVETIAEYAIEKTFALTIYGEAKDPISEAEKYAKTNGINFSTEDIRNKTITVQFASTTVSRAVSLAVSPIDGTFKDQVFGRSISLSLDADVKIKLTLTEPDDYSIESVKNGTTSLTGTPVEGEPAYIYDISFTNRATVITVNLKYRQKTITIQKSIADTAGLADPVVAKITNKVTQGTKRPDSDNANNTWTCELKNGATELKFTVKATDVSCKPVVTYGQNHIAAGEPSVKDIARPKATEYTYTISATDLKDGDTITITEQKNLKCSVTLEEDSWAKVIPTISQDGKTYEPKSGDQAVYEIARGSELTIRADRKANVTLKSLTYKIGETTKTVTARNGMAEISFPDVREDIAVTVNATGGYVQQLQRGYRIVTPVKDVYNVSYDGSYTASAKQSWKDSGNDVIFTKAELFVGTAKTASYSLTTEKPQKVLTRTADKKGIAIAIGNVSEADRKQKLTLKLYEGEGEAQTLAASYTLQVYKPITTLTVRPASIQQMTDTQKEYQLTTDGEIAKLQDAFDVTFQDKDGNDKGEGDEEEKPPQDVVTAVSISGEGKLIVTTGNKLGEATITLTPRAGISSTAKKEITVKTTKMLESTKLAPTVTCVSNDISLTLTMALKNVPVPERGELFYKISAVAKGASGAAPRTVYVKRTGDSQTCPLDVQQAGEGKKQDYTVTVQLVYTDNKSVSVDPNGIATGDVTVANYSGTVTDAIAGKTVTKTFSTLDPAYEAKLQLTKKTTTVYTGQENVIVAVAKFDKKTTYTSIKGTVEADAKLHAAADPDTGEIKVSPENSLKPGKYAITVTADEDKDNGMAPSTAKIDITIVKGIETLEVDIPAESLYKAPKKAATIKPTVIYNKDKDAPKTKKVKWSITDASGNAFAADSYLGKMLSINETTGVVTVNKDFILSKDDEGNQFKIKATAKDFKENTESATSAIITITNKKAEIAALGIVKLNTDNTSYEIIALSTDPSWRLNRRASYVHGAMLVAFTKEVTEATRSEGITDEAALRSMTIPAENVSFTSGTKNKIAVGKTGEITVITPCKVTLTAATTDGGAQKKSMTVDIGYDNAGGSVSLQLQAAQFNGEYNEKGERQYDAKDFINEKLVYTNGSTLFKLTVTNGSGADPGFVNYTLTPDSRTKILYKDGNDIYIAAAAKDAKITLKENTDGAADPKTYTLENQSWADTTAPRVAAGQKLYAYGKKGEIYATLVPNAAALAKITDAKHAYVEIDWGKRTDKNDAALNALAAKITLGELPIEDGMIKLDVKEVTIRNEMAQDTKKDEITSDDPLIPGTYDLKVTFGKKDNGTFTALTLPAAAKVTVTAAKTVTFTPNSSYTFKKGETSVGIAYRTNATAEELKKFTYKYGLLNANVGGKSNKFKDYFKISDGTKISLKEGELKNVPKADLTGYLSYEAVINAGYCSNPGQKITGVVKITLK